MKLRLLALVLSASVLTACGGGKALNTEEAFNQEAADQSSQAANSNAYIPPANLSAAEMLNDPSSALANRTLYFSYNSTEMDQDARDSVVQHAKFLAKFPAVQIVLEGHADERGTREYNIALGQSRAEIVKRTLVLYGVSPSQIRLISYGEEKPAVMGHSADAWAQNRRVELRYKG